MNSGTCTITGTGYQCTCPAGLSGTRCEIDINECASAPCQNAGICLQPSLNLYQCLCPTGNTHCDKLSLFVLIRSLFKVIRVQIVK